MKTILKNLSAMALCLLLFQGVNAQKFVVPEIPGNIEQDEYSNYNQDAMNCINWLKNNSPKHVQRKDVASYVIWWLTGTPDVHITLNADAIKFDDGNLLVLCLCGWAEHAGQNKDDDAVNGCMAGVETALNYYEKYKSLLSKDKGAEKLLKMRNKGTLKSFIEKAMNQ
jgi:hypothetical protein